MVKPDLMLVGSLFLNIVRWCSVVRAASVDPGKYIPAGLSKHLREQISSIVRRARKTGPLLNTIERSLNILPRSRARNPNGPDDIENLHNKLGRKPNRPTGMLKNTRVGCCDDPARRLQLRT